MFLGFVLYLIGFVLYLIGFVVAFLFVWFVNFDIGLLILILVCCLCVFFGIL